MERQRKGKGKERETERKGKGKGNKMERKGKGKRKKREANEFFRTCQQSEKNHKSCAHAAPNCFGLFVLR